MKYRADIDGLRAIAVLMVVIFHFKKSLPFNGFMGVDIFFVISGFLITGIIHREISENRFSISEFYYRRARRIVPALLVVLSVTTVVAFVLFLPDELFMFSKSVMASLLFSSNILFYSESGYFDASGELKPLLHTWSLSVEEQFYIVFPFLLLFLCKCGGRWLKPAVIGVFAVSFVAGIWTELRGDPSFAFYMFPTRAWEFLAGAFVSLGILPKQAPSAGRLQALSAVGLALIVLGAGVKAGEGTSLPYVVLVAPVVLGTMLVIYAGQFGRKTWVNDGLSNPVMLFFGKISYSLYLWHWPLYVFTAYYLFDRIETAGTIFLITSAIILPYLSWRWVEQPFRRGMGSSRRRASLASAVVLFTGVAAFGFYGLLTTGKTFLKGGDVQHFAFAELGGNYKTIDRRLPGEEAGIDVSVFGATDDLKNATVALIGDSHALAISPALDLEARASGDTAILLRNECLIPSGNYDVADEKSSDCIAKTEQQLRLIAGLPKVDRVIIAQRWNARTEDFQRKHGVPKDKYLEYRRATLLALVRRLEVPGRKVVLMAQVPRIQTRGENIPSIYARLLRRGDDDAIAALNPTVGAYMRDQRNIIPILEYVADRSSAEIVWPHRFLCGTERCAIGDDKLLYYWDDDHLSRYGAQHIAEIFAPYLRRTSR